MDGPRLAPRSSDWLAHCTESARSPARGVTWSRRNSSLLVSAGDTQSDARQSARRRPSRSCHRPAYWSHGVIGAAGRSYQSSAWFSVCERSSRPSRPFSDAARAEGRPPAPDCRRACSAGCTSPAGAAACTAPPGPRSGPLRSVPGASRRKPGHYRRAHPADRAARHSRSTGQEQRRERSQGSAAPERDGSVVARKAQRPHRRTLGGRTPRGRTALALQPAVAQQVDHREQRRGTGPRDQCP